MPIIKAGFTAGFRGRTKAPAWNRRAHYLARQEGRDSARLLCMSGQDLAPSQAIEVMGGAQGEYHEVIVAPSTLECQAIWTRCPEAPQRAVEEAGNRIAKAYAQGRPYVLAIHEQDGRFHFHVAVAGQLTEHALGKHGKCQKAWTQEFGGDEPRIQDWAAHLRFKEEKTLLQQAIREQKENDLQRRESVARAPLGQKTQAARPFEKKARVLIERRYTVEVRAILARYEARGTLRSPQHHAEVEQADHRRSGAIHRLEKRETSRHLGAVKARLGRTVSTGGRVAQKGVRTAVSITSAALEHTLKELGVPAPVRKVTRTGLVLAEGAIQTVLSTSQEAAKAAIRGSAHLTHASLKLGIGLVAAIPSGGASLTSAGTEAGQDLASAGKELGHGALLAGAEIAKGTGRTLHLGTQELIPRELRLALSMATTLAKTTLGVVKDTVTLSPLSLAKGLAGGAMEVGKTTANAVGLKASLPEPLRRAFQLAGWIPLVGIAVKAAELSAETAQSAINAASRSMEVDR